MKTETLKKQIEKFGNAHDVSAFGQLIKEMTLMCDGMEHVLTIKKRHPHLTQDELQVKLDEYFIDHVEEQ